MVVMTEAVPSRTDAQRMVALELANEVRVYRADMKKAWKAGTARRRPLDVIADPLPVEESWKVFALLLALPKHGRVKANKIIQRCGISPSKTVGGLSDRQRAELVGRLSSGCGGTVRS